jgi:hypothetical protein
MQGSIEKRVVTGLFPVIPLRVAGPCQPKRYGRDKPGHDRRSYRLARRVPGTDACREKSMAPGCWMVAWRASAGEWAPI